MYRIRSDKAVEMVLTTIFASTAVAYFILFGYTTLAYEGRFSPDSIFYVDTANNLAAGRGLSTSMAELERVIELDEHLPKPMTVWGPGYPIAIAAASAFGVSTAASALMAAVMGYALSVGFAWWISARYAGLANGALIAAALLYFAPLSDVSRHAWSETTAMAFAFAMVVALAAGNRKSLWLVALAGLFTGAAIATRYAFAPLILIGLICAYTSYAKSVKARMAAFTIPAVFLAGPVFARNILLTGHAGGSRWHAAGRPLAEGASETLLALPSAFSFSSSWLLIAVLAIVLGDAAWRFRRRGPHTVSTISRPAAFAILTWPVLYIAFLLSAQTRIAVDTIDARLLFPAALSVVLAGSIALLAVLRPHRWSAFACAILLAGYAAWFEAENARMIHGAGLPPVYDAERALSKPGPLAWLASNATPDDLVIAQDALEWPLHLGPIPTIFFSFEGAPSWFEYGAITAYLNNHECGAYRKVFVVIGLSESGNAPGAAPQFYHDLAVGNLASYPAVSELTREESFAIFEFDCEQLEA